MNSTQRYIECALANTPDNVRVVRLRNLGQKCYAEYDTGVLAAPAPLSREALYVFLHECGHFVLHGTKELRKGKPEYVKEMEAEQWAHAKMREAGFAVPRSSTRHAKRYVQAKMALAKRPNAEALAFAGAVPKRVSAITPPQADGRKYVVRSYLTTEAEIRDFKAKVEAKYGPLEWTVKEVDRAEFKEAFYGRRP